MLDVSLSSGSTVPDAEKTQDTANISGDNDEHSRVSQQSALLDKNLSNYKQEKLKRRLPTNAQLAQNVKKDLEVKRRLLYNMEWMDKEHLEAKSMAANIDKLVTSVADRFSLLGGLLLPQQAMYKPPMFEGHQELMHPPQVRTHTMYSRQGQLPMYQSQQGTHSSILNEEEVPTSLTPYCPLAHSN